MDLRKRLYQHGDVVLIKINSIPEGAKKLEVPEKNFILEKGEGIHTHVIKDTERVDVYEKDGTLYLVGSDTIELDHEEHKTQVIAPNTIEKRIEREWDAEALEARETQD
jgi:hypothetical protein